MMVLLIFFTNYENIRIENLRANNDLDNLCVRRLAIHIVALVVVQLGSWAQTSLADSPGQQTEATIYVSTYVGTGVPGNATENESRFRAAMAEPYGLVCDRSGNLYYSDYENNKIRRVDAKSGKVTTAAEVFAPQRLALDGRGGLYVGSMHGVVWKVDLTTGQANVVAGGGTARISSGSAVAVALGEPAGMHIDSAGDVYIADEKLHAVFRLTPATGQLTVVAGKRGQRGFMGDGGPATQALLSGPADVEIDSSGNLYIVEAENHVVRFVSSGEGTISTLAGAPMSKGFSGDGGSSDIRFNRPQDLHLTEDGRLLIADSYNHRARELNLQTGVISTMAGSGGSEYAGENISAPESSLPYPVAITSNQSGTFFISSPKAHRIFRIGAQSVIPQPWWLSPWSWLTCFSIVALLLYGVADIRARQLRVRASLFEEEVDRRTVELANQNEIAEQQSKRLAELSEANNRVLAQISHEFRTPLTVIIGPLDRMRELASSDKEGRYFDTTQRNASRLLRLVDQMLGLTIIGAVNAEPTSPVPATSILRQVVASFQSLAEDRGIALDIFQTEAIMLQSTKDAVETIIVNLVSNAIKYSAEGGQVSVSLCAQELMGVLSVADRGRGIATESLEQIFEPFERAHNEAERIPGSGLGLAVAKELVETHGGRVEVDSVPGKGSTFRVFLPLANIDCADKTIATAGRPSYVQDEVSALRSRFPLVNEDTSKDPKLPVLLVVEDNVDMRSYLVDMLTPYYRCLQADDAQSAIRLATTEIPDIVVSDVVLPGKDGFSICKYLRNDDRSSHIPIILLTAQGGPDNKWRGLAEKADDYIAKPFDESELLHRIDNLLELRRLLQARYSRDVRFDLSTPSDLPSKDRKFLENLGCWLAGCYQNSNIGVSTMAAAIAASERQIQRKLQALIGLSPSEFLRDYRLLRAHEFLLAGGRPGEVAFRCGFTSHAHFSSCFKAEFGYPPSQACRKARVGK